MLDPSYIRDHIDEVRTALRRRGLEPDRLLEEIATLETARRRLIPELEGLKRQQNTSGDAIAQAKRQGKDTARIQEANKARRANQAAGRSSRQRGVPEASAGADAAESAAFERPGRHAR